MGTEYQMFNGKEYVSLRRFWNMEGKYNTEKAKNEQLEKENKKLIEENKKLKEEKEFFYKSAKQFREENEKLKEENKELIKRIKEHVPTQILADLHNKFKK